MIGPRGRFAAAALISTLAAAAAGQAPAVAEVTGLSGSALGFYTNVGLFGGPQAVRGGPGSTCGQPGQPACALGESPSVTLPSGGGSQAALDPDGNATIYGPARIFENHGQIAVRTEGAPGTDGSATSGTVVDDIQPNDPFTAPAPGGVSSTCTATEASLSGSTAVRNGRLVLHDPDTETSGEAGEVVVTPPVSPAPNTTYFGIVGNVNDYFRIVFNEQVLAPDAITVNAVHMYLLGPTAVGDQIIGQARCGVAATSSNQAPVANDEAYVVPTGRSVTVPAAGVLGNDSDPEGGPLSAAKAPPTAPPTTGTSCGTNPDGSPTCEVWAYPSDPASGTLVLNHDGSFTYTPDAGFIGTDSFTYLAHDRRGASDTGTVTLNVVANRPPMAVDDAYSTGAGLPLSVAAPGVVGNDTDPDGDAPLSAGGASDPPHGTVVLQADGSFLYVPDPLFTGTDTFTYTVSDPRGATDAGTVTISVGPTSPPVRRPVADFDGDGSTDVAVYRPDGNGWYVQGGLTTGWGVPGDVPVPADYDGDGDADVAVYRPSDQTWYVQGGLATQWGTHGDVPVPADYDGDGDTDVAVFRPADQTWYVQGGLATQWGITGDVPVPADYDGDGDTDVAVFRPSDQTWYVKGGLATQWGTDGDVPVPADYDGNGTTDVAVFRPADQTWYSHGPGGIATQWGANGDIAVPGDYDGDSQADVAVYRPSDQTWYAQGGLATQWGAPGDIPLTVPAHLRELYGL